MRCFGLFNKEFQHRIKLYSKVGLFSNFYSNFVVVVVSKRILNQIFIYLKNLQYSKRNLYFDTESQSSK
jgi:hypothetical protein